MEDVSRTLSARYDGAFPCIREKMSVQGFYSTRSAIVKFNMQKTGGDSNYLSDQGLKNHFTYNETVLLSVHDRIIKAISQGHQQVTCLTLLDFSAAIDTINHTILLARLSACMV
jgi:hypothetical protein